MHVQKLDYVHPLKLYSAIRDHNFPFILESAGKFDRKARYTYISANPEYVVEIDERGTRVDGKRVSDETNPFKSLKEFLESEEFGERFVGGLVGYVAYNAVYNYIEGKIEEPSVFCSYDNVFIYDNILNKLYFLGRSEDLKAKKIVERAKRERVEREKGESFIIGLDAGRDDFIEMVLKAKDYIYSGDVFQVVLSREYEIDSDLSSFQIYMNLREINPSPYMFCLEFKKDVIGASPETMASVEKKTVKINPIAGTAPRGRSEVEDGRLAQILLKDEKERAEHVMLVDLARNDLRRVCKAGSIRLAMFMEVLKYSHVQHIESEIIGELEDGKGPFEAMESAFPAGTLTGAPKLRAMEIIDELEMSKRRVYGGCVGYFSKNGWADMAIAIRMVERDDVCRVRAGAGIVADSSPEKEFAETERKMFAVMKALGVENDFNYR